MVTLSDPNMMASDPWEGFPEGFPFPPSTGPTLPTWPDDVKSRQDAIDFGQKHADALAALERLANQNGGGLMGVAKAFLNEYERRQLITAKDKERLTAILTAFKDMDPVAGIRRIQEIHQEAVSDPTSKPAALGISSIAASSAAASSKAASSADAAMMDKKFASGFATGYADAVGAMMGGFGGPAGMYGLAVASSSITLSLFGDHP